MSLNLPNPWSRALWNVTAQMQFARKHGMPMAQQYARAAGVEIGATKPAEAQPAKIVERRNFILNKKIEVGGEGSDGFGPPLPIALTTKT